MTEQCLFKDLKQGDIYYEETNDFSAPLRIKSNDARPADEELANRAVKKVCVITYDQSYILREKDIDAHIKEANLMPFSEEISKPKRGRPRKEES